MWLAMFLAILLNQQIIASNIHSGPIYVSCGVQVQYNIHSEQCDLYSKKCCTEYSIHEVHTSYVLQVAPT